jgi:rubrerythrin
MLEQAILRQRFESLLKTEQEVQRAYEELSRLVQDPLQQAQIQQLIREKQRHIELTQRLLELVE